MLWQHNRISNLSEEEEEEEEARFDLWKVQKLQMSETKTLSSLWISISVSPLHYTHITLSMQIQQMNAKCKASAEHKKRFITEWLDVLGNKNKHWQHWSYNQFGVWGSNPSHVRNYFSLIS